MGFMYSLLEKQYETFLGENFNIKPSWGMPHRVIKSTPFYDLLKFGDGDTKILMVGAMAGHYSTIIRPTVHEFAEDHSVYVIDWCNSRDISTEHGKFNLNEYVECICDTLTTIGGDTHILAVCQPGPSVLVATSLMYAENSPYAPLSITLMGSPIDTRVNPATINKIAGLYPMPVFKNASSFTIPSKYEGRGRRVYPGLLQLSGFLSVNIPHHTVSAFKYGWSRLRGDKISENKFREFYNEYFAVMDVPSEYYTHTIKNVFKEHNLPKGTWEHRGDIINLESISCPLLTVEGGNDNLCPPGQTRAAHDLCTAIPKNKKKIHVQDGVGHYGIFSGSSFKSEISNVIREFIRDANQ